MARGARGAEHIEAMIDSGELQKVSGGDGAARALLDMARQHVTSATACVELDAEGAYALAYDAARKAATSLLAHQGLRPTN